MEAVFYLFFNSPFRFAPTDVFRPFGLVWFDLIWLGSVCCGFGCFFFSFLFTVFCVVFVFLFLPVLAELGLSVAR